MARRGEDEPPEEERRDRSRRTGIGDARAFSPRGRTTRDTEQPSAPRDSSRDSARDLNRAYKSTDRKPDAEARKASLRMVRGGRAEQQTPRRPQRTGGVPPRQRLVDRRPSADHGRDRPPVVAQPPRLGEPRRRLRLATALSLLLFTVIGIRLVQLQLTDAPAYAAAGLKERLDTLVLPAPRGAIYDRTGAVLAHSVEGRYVAVDPELVVDPKQTAVLLAPLLGKAPSEVEPLLQKKKQAMSGKPVRFQWLARGLSVQTAQLVMQLALPGIRVERDERRDLPGNDLAANLIGFTGTDMTGLAGIEARFDELLRGRNGELVYEVGQGALRAPIPSGYRLETPAQPGSSITLTIDRDVQFNAQRVLADNMRKVHATFGAAIIMDVRTGEIIAQASYPTYNAANPLAATAAERGDAATNVVVDPGSVHKAIVLAASLQEGVIKPNSTVVVGPTIKKGDQVYRDTHPFAEGTRITLPGLMAYSSNVGTIKIAGVLGAQKLYDYQRLFGLGKPTGIGVPGESAGLVQPPANWSASSYGSIPIGHSVAVTPLQMAAAYAAIANDGVWIQPHLIKETTAPNGTATPAAQANSHRVISVENAAALRTIMEAVTTLDGATGRSAALPGYRIAGKTGTGAQVANGHYTKGEVASFIGMAPADHPRYLVAVFAHTPGGNGGTVAGPAFREMMAFTLRHFKVLPSAEPSPKFVAHY